MTYTPKSQRERTRYSSADHEYSEKHPVEDVETGIAMNLECPACKQNLQELNRLIEQGKTAVFVKFTKNGAVLHLVYVSRTLGGKR